MIKDQQQCGVGMIQATLLLISKIMLCLRDGGGR